MLVWACDIILEGVSDAHSKTLHGEEKLENIMEKKKHVLSFPVLHSLYSETVLPVANYNHSF